MHHHKLTTLKSSGEQPIDAFMRVSLRVNNEGYEVNPILLDMLHTKKFAGDNDAEDPYAHIDSFEHICGTFKLNAFTEEEMRLKLLDKHFLIRHSLGLRLCLQV